ncbi:transposase, partial [Streptococcus danieliae]|nr:transposase [Streptococcus danieliae]
DRNGEFVPKAIPSYSRRDDELEKMIIKLYQTGVTTREIANLIEQMFGHHYSPATVSNITQLTQENVTAFHERKLQERYSIVYLD